ncbi:Rieske (2Fe-2S) protein [Streptosporangium sp. CA-135522]|uniref:Rieske (2Fe-2S) protein n=1 Tax=Streptosporangium sp. CA-135522 TaxID=3240072 RepID=UPI003D8CDFC7
MPTDRSERTPTRRHVLGATAVVACGAALTGCAAGASTPGGVPPGVKGQVVAQAADIPVGGGKVISQWKIVITQPTAGVFKAFNATCPHRGCSVGQVADGIIRCPCHGSEFAADSGKCVKGPAESPLVEFALKVDNGGIVMV